MSRTPGIVIIILSDTTLPAAWTPASVLAARAKPTWEQDESGSDRNVSNKRHFCRIICIVLRHGPNFD